MTTSLLRKPPLLAIGVGLGLGAYIVLMPTLPNPWRNLLFLVVLAPFVALIVGDLKRLLLAVVMIDLPLQLDDNLFYQEAQAAFGAIGGLNVSITLLALLGLYALWMSESILSGSKRTKWPWPTRSVTMPLLAYIGVIGLSIVVAEDRTFSFFELGLAFQIFALYFYVAARIRTKEEMLFVVLMLLVGLFFESAVMIFLRLYGRSIEIGPILARIDDGSRVGGTIGGPNSASAYLGMFLTLPLSILFSKFRVHYKILALGCLVLGVPALLVTLSRGGLIAFIVSTFILSLLLTSRGWMPKVFPLVLGTVVLVTLLVFSNNILSSGLFGAERSQNALGRLPLLYLALDMIREHPILGVGANNFTIVMWSYITPDFSRSWLYAVHNKYLLVFAETGFIGLMTFLWFLGSVVRQGWQTWRIHDRTYSLLALALMAGIIGHMVHMQFDLFSNRPLVQSLWLSAGLLVALHNLTTADTNTFKPVNASSVQMLRTSYLGD